MGRRAKTPAPSVADAGVGAQNPEGLLPPASLALSVLLARLDGDPKAL